MFNNRYAIILMTLCVFSLMVFAQDTRPFEDQPYLGLAVRDTPDGLVVGWIYPGPLGGKSFTSDAGVQRGDNLVSINGQSVDAAGFRQMIESMSPGDPLTIVLRRSPASSMQASVPKGGPGGDEYSVEVVLSNKDLWTGTIGRGLGGRVIGDPDPGEFEELILAKSDAFGIAEADGGLDALLESLQSVQADHLDTNSLPAVVNVFRRPLSIDAVEASIAKQADRLREVGAKTNKRDVQRIAGVIHDVLDLTDDPGERTEGLLQVIEAETRWGAWTKATKLVAQMREDWSIQSEDAADFVRVIRLSNDAADPVISANTMAMQALAYRWETTVKSKLMMNRPAIDPDTYPDELREALSGDILAIEKDDRGNFMVLGGKGDNTYDMSKIAHVVDMGGNDRYIYPQGQYLDVNSPTRYQTIIDRDGNDHYEAMGDFFGPASGVFGFSLIDDRAGNDVYISHGQMSIGTGLFGTGVLLDRAGNDQYENVGRDAGFTMGVGFYGAGIIIDSGGGDTYIGEKLCQGIGGPRGFGAIIDASGDDLYRANGPTFGSAYGTPAVFLGMSQGFGYGIRGYASGGVGAIYDYAGNDQYEAGEFSQAGGYYYGLGILHDVAGHDLYYANRYGQAFAAHQAAGILIDDQGDDMYWSKTAASQAGTWDQSIGMLIDRAGNDSYRCDGLGQGGASMQAVALFLDLGGDDRYSSNPGAVLGQSGSNTYHFDSDRVMSFSFFLDAGNGSDIYGGGVHQPQRTNNVSHKTGQYNEDSPAESSLFGLFVDE